MCLELVNGPKIAGIQFQFDFQITPQKEVRGNQICISLSGYIFLTLDVQRSSIAESLPNSKEEETTNFPNFSPHSTYMCDNQDDAIF